MPNYQKNTSLTDAQKNEIVESLKNIVRGYNPIDAYVLLGVAFVEVFRDVAMAANLASSNNDLKDLVAGFVISYTDHNEFPTEMTRN